MSVFFTSDLHLGHKNALLSCNRPFQDVEEMNCRLIENWNKKVQDEDEVYILGDLSFRSDKHIGYYLNQMKGKKYLIQGNHDFGWQKNVEDLNAYFEKVTHMDVVNFMVGGKKYLCTLTHYPMLEWNRSRYAQHQEDSTSWLIHGHIHNSRGEIYEYIKQNQPCALNAGVDINGYEPVTFEELLRNNNIWYERGIEEE